MAVEIMMRRQMGALRPIDAMGEEALADVPHNELVRVTIKRPRNVNHHRKFWGLIAAIFPHQTLYPTEETLLAAMKVALGFGTQVTLPDKRVIVIPGSISFAKMDQKAFEEFYDRALTLILTRILPGVNKTELEREVSDILAGYRDDYQPAGAKRSTGAEADESAPVLRGDSTGLNASLEEKGAAKT